jgi:hypothetical protein
MVEIHLKAGLLVVEGLGAVHVRYRERYQLEPVVHNVLPFDSEYNALTVKPGTIELLYETAI